MARHAGLRAVEDLASLAGEGGRVAALLWLPYSVLELVLNLAASLGRAEGGRHPQVFQQALLGQPPSLLPGAHPQHWVHLQKLCAAESRSVTGTGDLRGRAILFRISTNCPARESPVEDLVSAGGRRGGRHMPPKLEEHIFLRGSGAGKKRIHQFKI